MAFASVFAIASLCSVTALAEPEVSENEPRGNESSESPSRPAAKLRASVAGGASTSRLFGLSSVSTDVGLGLVWDRGNIAIPLFLDAEFGQTSGGLTTGEITVGEGVQWIGGRVRLGGGLAAGYGWTDRAPSSSPGHIGMFVLDVCALAGVDLVDLGNHRALYLGVKPSVGVRWGETFFAWGHGAVALRGTALAGLRF